MIGFVLSRDAETDLLEIWSYLAIVAGHAVADRILEDIHDEIVRLAESPGKGSHRTDLAPEPFRVWRVHSYYLFYEATQPLSIARVLHTARDIQNAFPTGIV